MTSIDPTRPAPAASRGGAFLLAVVLPAVASLVTYSYPPLRTLPFALHYMAMVVVATLGGFAPALLSIFLSTVTTFYLLPEPHNSAHAVLVMALRPIVLVVSAVVITLMTRGQRRAAAALTLAHASLSEQSLALMESQQASKCAAWTYEIGDRTRWYPGGYEVFGIPLAELEKMPSPIPLIWAEDQPAVIAAVKKMVDERGALRVEYRVLHPNGELHWCEARGNPIEGQPRLWRGFTFDITERKLAEAALIRSEKLAAMGRLASTIAHEINNPLEAVTNLLYLARADRALNSSTVEYLAVADRELARVAEIARLALGFVRTSAQPREIQIAAVMEDVLALYRHRFEMRNVQIERRCDPRAVVRIAPQELRQIVTNLISNALDASPPGSRVSVHILHERDGHERDGHERDGLGGYRAVLRVDDNGTGIAPAHLHRIFDPFFTTKEDTGTGVGLWITRDFVEKNGGTITVESGALPGGVRTSFRVEFPACPPRAFEEPAPLAAAVSLQER